MLVVEATFVSPRGFRGWRLEAQWHLKGGGGFGAFCGFLVVEHPERLRTLDGLCLKVQCNQQSRGLSLRDVGFTGSPIKGTWLKQLATVHLGSRPFPLPSTSTAALQCKSPKLHVQRNLSSLMP